MSRILLISANVATEPYPVYPLGMAVVAAALAARGHQVEQCDLLACGRDHGAVAAKLRAFGPDYVGISLRNIDNVDSLSSTDDHWYLRHGRDLVETVRGATAAPVFVGGPALSILPDEIFAYLGADYALVGEGERTAPDLIDRLERKEAAPRITFAPQPGLGGADMHSPRFDAELAAFYLQASGMLNLHTKRGCPFRCTYCTYPSLEGQRFRHRPAAAVVDDLEKMQKDTGADHVFFTDSIFNDPGGRHLELAEEILRRNVQIAWSGFFRPQGLPRDDLALLKRSGLYAVELGTDASSDATLAGLDKGFTFAEVQEVNANCLAEEVPCAHFIIFGGPGETPDTVREGLANIEALGPAVVFAFSGIRILKGAALYARAVREGVIREDTPLLKPVYYFSPQIEPAAMNRAIEESFAGQRTRIFPPEEGQKRLEVMQRFGYRGLLWDKLVNFKGPRTKRTPRT